MIIKAKASTVRAAAKRAGELVNLTIRTGKAAETRELGYVDSNWCSVTISSMSPGVDKFFDGLVKRYGAGVYEMGINAVRQFRDVTE